MKSTIKRLIPASCIRRHRLHVIKKRWPTCDIRTDCINIEGCEFGIKVRIPASCEVWGGVIGDYSYIGEYSSIPYAIIGKYCSIGERCSIGGWQHDYGRISTSPRVYREILVQDYSDQNQQVVIGNDVWIGDNVVILKGKIGDGAVIGAGAVVTSNIPPYAIAVGNPAKVIKYRFQEDKIKQLLKEKWWDDIEKYREVFNDT